MTNAVNIMRFAQRRALINLHLYTRDPDGCYSHRRFLLIASAEEILRSNRFGHKFMRVCEQYNTERMLYIDGFRCYVVWIAYRIRRNFNRAVP